MRPPPKKTKKIQYVELLNQIPTTRLFFFLNPFVQNNNNNKKRKYLRRKY